MFMGSMLKKFDVLSSEVKISTYKNRDVNFRKFFDENFEYSMVYCKDIEGLLNELHFYSNVNLDWWLFIDGSVNSIKAVLLHKKMNLKLYQLHIPETIKNLMMLFKKFYF